MARADDIPWWAAARWIRVGPAASVAVAFSAGVTVSWRAWASLIIDCGRELQVPDRLLHGALLYRDARYYYGPLGPYLNAGLYGLFGTRVEVLAFAGMVAAALTAWGLVRLVGQFAGPWAGALVAVAFVGLCAFGHLLGVNIFSWPIPYSYPATYGMTAATWSLVFLLAHLRSNSRADYLASATCLAAVALTKIELLAALSLAHAVVGAALFFSGRLSARHHVSAFAAAFILPAIVYAGFAMMVGPALWFDNLGAMFNPNLAVFSRHALGLDDLGGSLRFVLQSTLLFTVLTALAMWAARLARGGEGRAALLAGAVGTASFLSAFFIEEPLRALPVVLLAGLVLLVTLAWREPAGRDHWVACLALFAFALACLGRIVLRVSPSRYGFSLLVPGLAALGVLFFDLLPGRLSPAGRGRWPIYAGGAGLLLGAAMAAFLSSARSYASYTEEVSTSRGRLRLPSNGIEATAVRRLAALPARTRVLAVAEGAGIVFMSGLEPAQDGMSSYLPIELVGGYDEPSVLARWRANPADIVLLFRRPLPEYGSRGFGVDYGLGLFAWLRQNYEPYGDLGGPIVLARLRSAVSGPVAPGVLQSGAATR